VRVLADLLDQLRTEVEGGQHGVAVVAVDADGIDVLQDAYDAHHFAIPDEDTLRLTRFGRWPEAVYV